MILGISATIGSLDTTAYGGAFHPGEREGCYGEATDCLTADLPPNGQLSPGVCVGPLFRASRKGKGRNNEAPLPWLFLYGSPQRA